METTMNRILTVTDEDDTLFFEYTDLDELREERIFAWLR
jgi:hypothetical protein